MPQNPITTLVVAPTNPSLVQEQISLGASFNVIVGNPGGPVVFANFGAMIVPVLSGGYPRNVAGHNTGLQV